MAFGKVYGKGVPAPMMRPPLIERDPMKSMQLADVAMELAERAQKAGQVALATMFYAKATALYGQANYYWITG